ncbi:MAG: LuxR family transcriptional regulator [Spirochaetia bacterium]|nr:LuxR family transcriptional regulator [Spirochaetia bacterium]
MGLEGLYLILYLFAFATGCMALVLSVVFHMRETLEWTPYFIVFLSSLLIIVLLQISIVFIHLFTSGLILLIFNYIITPVIILNAAFLIVFIPYFATWVIAQPWSAPYSIFFYSLSGVFIVLSTLDLIFIRLGLFSTLSSALFIVTLIFTISIILKNLKNIASKDVRMVCKTIIIISFSFVPLVILSLIFENLRNILYPLYFLGFSITIMVFLFIYFKRIPQEVVNEITLERLGEYRISEREFSVILLIKEGFTNKEIGDKLAISVNTVNNHIANIFTKTNVRSRIDLLNVLNER